MVVDHFAAAERRMGLREKARPIMERLAAETGEVVCLAVLERNRSVYVAVVEGRHGLRLRATVGSVAPLHASATGMVLLASMPEAEVRAIAAETGLPKFTTITLTQIAPLLELFLGVHQARHEHVWRVFTGLEHPYTRALLDCIPTIDPAQRGRMRPLAGEIPTPLNPPSGCRFHPRCPLAQPLCAEQEPPLEVKAEGHLAACHFA
jgi:oligopeptide/dipeptide ABC transporter ATP-binding protein